MSDIDRMRDILRDWGSYGPHLDTNGRLIGYWWERFSVDSMTDKDVRELAGRVAAQDPPERKGNG